MNNSTSKTAFVTGSLHGLGAKIAAYLADVGCNVITHSSKNNEDSNSKKHIVCNFTNPKQVHNSIEKLQNVEILINNASEFKKDDIDSVTFQNLQNHFMVGAFTPLILSSKLPKLKHIINILDGRICKHDSYFLSYTLCKKTLAEITKISAKSLASAGIRVNGIALGYVMRSENQKQDVYKKLVSQTPLGLESTISELLNCIEMLLNSSSITGNIIYLDSGMHL